MLKQAPKHKFATKHLTLNHSPLNTNHLQLTISIMLLQILSTLYRAAEVTIFEGSNAGKMEGVVVSPIIPEKTVAEFDIGTVTGKQGLGAGLRLVGEVEHTIAYGSGHIIFTVPRGDQANGTEGFTVEI